MKPYTLSLGEVEKLYKLAEDFQKHGFDVKLFPEVYYDTFENACKVFPDLEQNSNRFSNSIHPNFFGVYLYETFFIPTNEINFDATKEGIIILFRDRIEDNVGFGDNKNLRLIVLLYQISQWLIHFPKAKTNYFWKYGFEYSIPKTKEALSSILITWGIETNEEKAALNYLLPGYNSNFTQRNLVDNLTTDLTLAQEVLLEKIVILREAFYLKDKLMFDFLFYKNLDLKTYLNNACVEDCIEDNIKQTFIANTDFKYPLIRGDHSFGMMFNHCDATKNIIKTLYITDRIRYPLRDKKD